MWLKVLFLFVAVGAVMGAIGMLASQNSVHSALFLIFSLLCVAAIYLMLGAEFLAIVQIIVYAGAIMVLFLFVIMLLNLSLDEFGLDRLETQRSISYLFLSGLAVIFLSVGFAVTLPWASEGFALTSLTEMSKLLFSKYLLAFEIASLILLIAMIGIIVIVKRPQ